MFRALLPSAKILKAEIIEMLAIAWFWLSVFCLGAGVLVLARGLYMIRKNGRLGLRFVSCGSAIMLVGIVVTFLQL